VETKPLDVRVREALLARKGDWKAVADGSGVSYSWLSKFVNGHIDNPGYVTLTQLAAYLDRTKPRLVGDDPRAPSPALEAAIDGPSASDAEVIAAACLLAGEPRDDRPSGYVFNKSRASDKPNNGRGER
jgi:transcriptional regulator with XRE-family HTH domain